MLTDRAFEVGNGDVCALQPLGDEGKWILDLVCGQPPTESAGKHHVAHSH